MSPSWIRARIRKYAAQVELGYIPKVVFSEKEWRRLTPAAQWKTIGHGTVAAAYEGVVYINRSTACCRRGVDDSAAHEVVHMKWPKMRHTPKFYHYVSEILVGRYP